MGVFRRKIRGKVEYWIKFKGPTGKWRTRKGCATLRETNELLREIEKQSKTLSKQSASLAFTDVAEHWIAGLELAGKTARHIKEMRRYLTLLEDLNLGTFSEIADRGIGTIVEWLNRKETWGEKAKNAARGLLVSIGAYAQEQGFWNNNLFKSIPRAADQEPRHPKRALSEEEQLKLLQSPFAVSSGRADVYKLALTSGLRYIELKRLEVRDCDLENRCWRLRANITKNRRAVQLPMFPEAHEILVRLCAGKKQTDKVIDQMPWAREFDKDLSRNGIAKTVDGKAASFHSLRYSFCTRCAKLFPIQTVQKLMRHESIEMTTRVYLDLNLTDLGESIWRLPPFFGAGNA